ncbi:6-hydroxymethylpterin diphosphokinase MptE-like protein [Halodesulfurarchaeum sp.]|uniref:6-hydroxymethylpterin diphosphokinase MptE-like protein n=1 Tax=Halodesulfurarchaeum sp. TaxID=1980530 RepID=UPI002FC2D7DB
MKFETWGPIYQLVVRDFEYDPTADRRARDVLDDLSTVFDFDRLDFAGETVAIAGGSKTLERELEQVRTADRVIAVSNAARVLQHAGISPDLGITDLDKAPETHITLSKAGVPIGIHGHGDNIPAVKRYLPRFDQNHVFGTTQVEPTERVVNFGGFTDGDRAAFLADHFGADQLTFPGWQFDDATVSMEKNRKLMWAGRLLRCLERRRHERFPVLDGMREELEDFPGGESWNCIDE